jgi:hypothetical protein
MVRGSRRLLAATLIDWTGTGLYVAISAIFLTRLRPVGARRDPPAHSPLALQPA